MRRNEVATASRWPIGETFEIELPLVDRFAGFLATALVTEIAACSPTSSHLTEG